MVFFSTKETITYELLRKISPLPTKKKEELYTVIDMQSILVSGSVLFSDMILVCFHPLPILDILQFVWKLAAIVWCHSTFRLNIGNWAMNLWPGSNFYCTSPDL